MPVTAQSHGVAVERLPDRLSAPTHGRQLSKRILDLAVALAAFFASLPLWIVIYLAVRLSSPGPVFFRQCRVGLQGCRFTLFKFRTMRSSADDSHRDYIQHWIHDGEQARQGNALFKIAHDPRITPLGRFLRKYSLDELPQLFNIVRGEMSLVGPRPATPYEVAEYQPWEKQRLTAKPGLTGLWQVSGRNCLSFERMVELDIEYIRNWTFLGDLRILLRTIPVVLRGTGH